MIGECKFKNRPFQYSEYLDTITKLAPEQEAADFYYAIFSLSGFEDKLIQDKAMLCPVQVILLEVEA